MNKEAICWINGAILPASEASISVFDHGLLYGDGVFEGIRFYHAAAFRLEEHLRRLQESARAIALHIPYSTEQLIEAIRRLVASFPEADGYIRLVVTRGVGPLGINPDNCAEPTVLMIADHLNMISDESRRKGARLIIASTRRLPPDGLDPRIKSLNYLNHIMARIEANHAGADEALLLNGRGHIAEGTTDNVFIVRNGELITPPIIDGALDGITRGIVIRLAKDAEIPVHERSIGPFDVHNADECFLTGTGAELIPVNSVDGRLMQRCPGEVFDTLNARFRSLIDRECRNPA